jgi:AcrR family transcriptional regulator
MGGPQKPKAQRIKDLIDAAEIEFSSKRYDEVTMELIAVRAGLGRTSGQHYFPNKDAVLAAVQERFYEPVRGLMAAADVKPDPVDALRKFVFDYLKYWSSHPRRLELHLMLMAKIVGNEKSWPMTNAYVAEMINWYDTMYWRAAERNLLSPWRPLERGTALFCAVEGALPHVTTSKLLTVRKAAARIEKALLKG